MFQGPLWRRRQRLQQNEQQRQLQVLQNRFRDEKSIQAKIYVLENRKAELERVKTERLQALNDKLTTNPASVLKSHNFPAIAGIENPVAALALIKHYGAVHQKLTPGLEELKTTLENGLTDDAKNLAEKANDERYSDMHEWLNNNQGDLAEFANTSYQVNCLAEKLNAPKPTSSSLTLDKDAWLLHSTALNLRKQDATATQSQNVYTAVTNIAKAIPDGPVNRLTNDIKKRHKQLMELQQTLKLTNNEKLMKNYKMQMEHYSAELNTLHKHVMQITKNSPEIRSGVSQDLNALEKAAKHFHPRKEDQVKINTFSGVATHYERQQNGTYVKVPVVNKETGKELKITAEEAINIVEQMKLEYASKGLKCPVKGYSINKNGDVTFNFSSPHAKEDFFARGFKLQEQNTNSSQEAFKDRSASAHKVNDKAPSASATQVPTPTPHP